MPGNYLNATIFVWFIKEKVINYRHNENCKQVPLKFIGLVGSYGGLGKA
jgi:hypothetical protein